MKPDLLPNIDFAALPRTYELVIPEKFLDEMGHMNVSWYTHLFSEAMGGIMGLVGLSLEYIETEKMGGVALEGHIHYLAEVHVGESVTIYSRLIERTEKRVHLVHFMVNESRGNVAALFENIMACFDLKARRMAPIPNDIATKIDDAIEKHQQLDWPPPLCGVMKP